MRYDYIFGPPVLALVFLLLGWPYARVVAAGRPLSKVQRVALRYGFAYVLGMGYLMAIVSTLGWKGHWAIVLTVIWALVLALLAWRRHRSKA